MSTETTPAAVETPASATSELPNGAAAAPADGGAAPSQTQQGDDANAPQNGGEGQGQPKTPDHRTPQYRFSELTRQRNEAERAAAEERGRRLALEEMVRNGLAPRAEQAPQAQADADPKPDPSRFPGGKYDDNYLEAVAEWSGRQAALKLAEKSAQAAREAEIQAAQQAEWDAAGERYKATVSKAQAENYFEGERLLRGLVEAKNYDLVDDITDSANPHALAQWLATPKQNAEHETYRKQVLDLPARQRQRELARVDDMLTRHFASQRTPAPRTAQSQAPNTSPAPSPSPTPTAPGNGAGAPFDPNRGDMDGYVAWRRSQAG